MVGVGPVDDRILCCWLPVRWAARNGGELPLACAPFDNSRVSQRHGLWPSITDRVIPSNVSILFSSYQTLSPAAKAHRGSFCNGRCRRGRD
jgi:hypothetical protein